MQVNNGLLKLILAPNSSRKIDEKTREKHDSQIENKKGYQI